MNAPSISQFNSPQSINMIIVDSGFVTDDDRYVSAIFLVMLLVFKSFVCDYFQ